MVWPWFSFHNSILITHNSNSKLITYNPNLNFISKTPKLLFGHITQSHNSPFATITHISVHQNFVFSFHYPSLKFLSFEWRKHHPKIKPNKIFSMGPTCFGNLVIKTEWYHSKSWWSKQALNGSYWCFQWRLVVQISHFLTILESLKGP